MDAGKLWKDQNLQLHTTVRGILMERSLSYVNLSILKKQTRDMSNNNNNTLFNNISLQTEFFHLHQISYSLWCNLT